MKFRLVTGVLVALLATSVAAKECEVLEGFVRRPGRPTLAEVVGYLRANPDCVSTLMQRAPDSRLALMQDARTLRAKIEQNGPRLVGFFTGLFPRATLATLGRDAFAIADLLEAHFVAKGLASPVVRLGASRETVLRMGNDDRMVEFLVSNGLDLDALARGTRQFVMIDRTQYSSNSQMRRFAAAVMSEASTTERRHAYMLNYIPVGSDHGWLNWRFAGVGGALRTVRRMQFQRVLYNAEVQSEPQMVNAPELAAKLTDINEVTWHATFGATLVPLEDGRLSGQVGQPVSSSDRWKTLRMFWELYEIASSAPFQAEVAAVELELAGPPAPAPDQARARERLAQDFLRQALHPKRALFEAHKVSLLGAIWDHRERQFEARREIEIDQELARFAEARRELPHSDLLSRTLMELSLDMPVGQASKNYWSFVRFLRIWFMHEPITGEEWAVINAQVEWNLRREIFANRGEIDVLANLSHCSRNLEADFSL